ncbi:MAG: glycosyltransferase [Eubacterium sp.]|nr:glycosyltransferase [Eubacterium sp.]
MEPLITVIVPVYNVEKYLDKCVESIVNQTYTNLEIILVDDGSPDNCPQMCDEWAQKDSRIKVIHKVNSGVSSARNSALEIAKGEYIGFVDSDDYCKLNMYEILLRSISDNNADVVVCNNTHVNDKGEVIKITSSPFALVEGDDLLNNFIFGNLFDSTSTCNKLFKSKIIIKNNIRFNADIKVGEDLLFNYYALKKAQRLVSITDVLYNYVFHDKSVMRSTNSNIISRWKNIKAIMLAEKDNKRNYYTGLAKYQSELLCCLRELLKSNNHELIAKHYKEITDEIKQYSKEFLQIADISKINKLSIKTISFSPKLFKLFYLIYLKKRGKI